MLGVLLVDDEPYILQGLSVLIDWEQEGYEIVGRASNGQEALGFLETNPVDLVITDIKMPVMTGLELLIKVRKEKISNAYFVILSGYADFCYAQEAMRYDCMDYILKPVDKEMLKSVIHKVFERNVFVEQKKRKERRMQQAYLARNTIALIQGKYDNMNLEFVEKYMRLSKGVRYIEIDLDGMELNEELMDEEKRGYQRKLHQACLDFLGEDGGHCVFDVSGHEKIYDIGFVYCEYMAVEKKVSEKRYMEQFLEYVTQSIQMPVIMLVGKKVNEVSQIAKSYSTACVLRSLKGFRDKKEIYYYEEEVQVSSEGIVLCKDSLDALLASIEQNRPAEIKKSVTAFYQEMKCMGVRGTSVQLNINYMLFQLIHLACQQDDDINQEEILKLISESSFEDGIKRGSKAHLKRFACEYADYLAQLRKNVSRGILGDIEREIRENYAKNITLKELSEKYYVNSAYIGQLFRKKYNQSFRDYLNDYRMEQAAKKLVRTDEKIRQIADEVGFRDLDYFVNRFIMAKGCTPSKFRRQARESL